MFTGSFHPIEDRLWENRIAWDKRVAPKEASTLREIFEHRLTIRRAKLRLNAQKVLTCFTPYLTRDPINLIMEYFSANDFALLNTVCKIDCQIAPQVEVTVTNIPLPVPASSPFFGNQCS
jgi:hypothetical protein